MKAEEEIREGKMEKDTNQDTLPTQSFPDYKIFYFLIHQNSHCLFKEM